MSKAPRPLTPARLLLVIGGLGLVLLVSVCLALALGPGGSGLDGLWPLDPTANPASRILLYRLPRVLLAVLVGVALSSVGVVFQAFLRNPLADPFLMGVSGGAALGGSLGLVLFGAGLAMEGPLAFGGAVAATALVFRLGRVGGRIDPTTVLLVGVVLNSFCSAVILFLKVVISAQESQQVLFWLMGSLDEASARPMVVGLLAAFVLPGVGLLWTRASGLNALALGERGALHLGVDVERLKRFVFLAGSLLTGLAVAVSGMIGFVGLIVPHIARLLFGPDHRLLLPAAALLGGAFLVLTDLGARLLLIPLTTEPPVGAVTAFLGGPFFLLLLLRRERRL